MVEDGCGVGVADVLGAGSDDDGQPAGAELVWPGAGLDDPVGQFGSDGLVDPPLEEPLGLDEVDSEPPPLGFGVDALLDGAGLVVVCVGAGVDVVRSGAGADARGESCADRVATGGPGLTGGSVGS